eukprot:TRINITY_DN3285_c0_g1_i1.p1 TRINITY_DN3285_c0_g1~~TRINITY_DN3285_c0_g1_i1.p1  ORF type:complete len:236 (-),score=33.35 TRINITY_DN3285_c0_g1_i1:74-781(-)
MKDYLFMMCGVSASGKTTQGTDFHSFLREKLPQHLDKCEFRDADDFHPKENIEKMKSGIPLDDNDRQSWLKTMSNFALHFFMEKTPKPKVHTVDTEEEHESRKDSKRQEELDKLQNGKLTGEKDEQIRVLILACSALKKKYRSHFREMKETLPILTLTFVILHGPENILQERIHRRKGHYMPPSLLKSQLDTLELPDEEEKDSFRDCFVLGIEDTPRQHSEQVYELVFKGTRFEV